MSKINENTPQSMRLDKWLWCARFYKTRSIATSTIKAGKIKAKGIKVKPAQIIRVGDELEIRRGSFQYEIRVSALTRSRGSAADAVQLYLESEDSITKREALASQLKLAAASQPASKGRPSKQERRKIIRFTRRAD